MLPYSAEAYFALFSDYNQAIRPVPALALFLAAGVVALAVRSQQDRGRYIAVILAAGWAWTGIAWHIVFFRDLNFAAPFYGGMFVCQALVLVWIGVYRAKIGIGIDGSPSSWIGISVLILAVFLLPLADWLDGTSWTQARLALIAPGATAALTVGILLLSSDRARYVLLVIPVFWLLATGAHAWILGILQDYALAAAGAVALVSGLLKLKRRK